MALDYGGGGGLLGGQPRRITLDFGEGGRGERSRRGPMGSNAASLQPMGGGEPRVGIPRMPSQPIPVPGGGIPPGFSFPGGPGLPPGVGLPGVTPPMPPAGVSPMPILPGGFPLVPEQPFQMPQQVDWQALLPLLLQMGAIPRGAFDRMQQ